MFHSVFIISSCKKFWARPAAISFTSIFTKDCVVHSSDAAKIVPLSHGHVTTQVFFWLLDLFQKALRILFFSISPLSIILFYHLSSFCLWMNLPLSPLSLSLLLSLSLPECLHILSVSVFLHSLLSLSPLSFSLISLSLFECISVHRLGSVPVLWEASSSGQILLPIPAKIKRRIWERKRGESSSSR